jgi:ferritin-like metal-binding protein YciE
VAKSETPARDAVIVKYLNEAFGKEKQLETQLQTQIGLAKRKQLKKGFQEHLKVTKNQSRGLAKRIRELGHKAEAGPDFGPASSVAAAASNLANRAVAASKGPAAALRGTSDADNDLRMVRDSLWHEAEEIAHYDTIEAVANELDDKDTAKLAKQYRREEEKMQRLLERQIPQLIKAVIKEEVPSEQRGGGSRGRSSSRSSSSRSSGGQSKSKRSQAAQKGAATRQRRQAASAAKSTAQSARSTARKSGQAARSTAKSAGRSGGSSS